MLSRLFIVCALLSLTGCGDNQENSKATQAKAAVIAPAGLFVTNRPADAKGIADVKANAAKGDTVRLMGRVGGKADPFVTGNAIFVAVDPKLISCELMGDDDHCAIPWDYCCEDADDLLNGMATIRITDDAGRPLPASAKGMGGLGESRFVLVEGEVYDRNDHGLFIVDAKQIWVGGKPSREDPDLGSQ